MNLTETTFGSIATYSCDEGFGIQGSSERVCEATGRWNRSQPSCESKGGRDWNLEREEGVTMLHTEAA